MNPASEPTCEQFGPYEVFERLGVGGMATVYRAKKRGPAGFERTVALKRMLQNLADDPTFVESFVREAKVASMLVHPNIAQVYDFGRISGTYYIAMELVAGFDIRKLLRYANKSNEAIPLPVILSIVGELCDALEYAHSFVDEQGVPLDIVHRDISPSNLIVAHTGHLKVIDFGIAKANSRQLHTESGHVKGKLGYMSPEVALGMPFGPVSDIFSVGVVAWELVTASPLFSAKTDFETMRKVREEPITPPSRFNPACPPKLEQIIIAALDRDPERRLASARLFRNALDDIAASTGMQASARAVAEWMHRFAQPDDLWMRASSRNRSPSGRQLPLPPEPPTAVIKGSGHKLRRSAEAIQLATELWGDDARPKESEPDFSIHGLTPQPAATKVETSPTRTEPAPIIETTPAPTENVRPTRTPLVILGVLALIAAALAAILIVKQSATPPKALLRFEVEPAGAVVEVGGNPVGNTSPLETRLAAGSYPVAIHLDGYKPWSGTLVVRAGEPQTLRIALDREAAPADVKPPVVATQTPRPAKAQPTPARRPTPHVAPKKLAKVEKPVEKEPEPEPEPPKPIEKPPEPPPPPPPPAPPARTPVVAASAVTKLSGEVPVLRAKSEEGTGEVLAKMCIDDHGRVTSVKVIKSSAEIAADLQRALMSWRYKPYINKDGKPSPVCFPLQLRVVVKPS